MGRGENDGPVVNSDLYKSGEIGDVGNTFEPPPKLYACEPKLALSTFP